jgi:TrmH family RNA methyltransferase
MPITSPHNDKLKEIRRLQRRREGRFVAEGEDLLAAAVEAGWEPVYTLRAGEDVAPELLDGVSALGSGTRVMGVFEARFAPRALGPVCVFLHGVKDPGNVGTVLRSALAFGAGSVVLGPGCADPFGPKAVRASMGAIFSVPVLRGELKDVPGSKVALVAHAGEPLRDLAARAGDATAVTLVVGAERDGLPQDIVEACDFTAHIPITSDSLNAAMAATIGLYELTRATRVRA